jgi:hypothetical protein
MDIKSVRNDRWNNWRVTGGIASRLLKKAGGISGRSQVE